MKTSHRYKYDIAISFAEEEHDIAKMLDFVFNSNRFKKIRAFYYPKFEQELMGEDLTVELPIIYGQQAKYALIILSKPYLTKYYCQIELDAIKKRRSLQKERYVFIIQKDDTTPEEIGLPAGLVYHKWDHNPERFTEILQQILKKRTIPVWTYIVGLLLFLGVCFSLFYLGSQSFDPPPVKPVTDTKEVPTTPSEPLFVKAFTRKQDPIVALLIIDANYVPQTSLSNRVADVFEKRDVEAHVGLLNPEVVNAKVIDELLRHNIISLMAYKPEAKLDYMAIGLLRYTLSKDDLGSNVVSAKLDLSITALNDSLNDKDETLSFTGVGTHTSKASAQNLAIQSLIGKMDYSLGYRFKRP